MARIYQARPELKDKIVENVLWRILNQRIRHANELPEEILRESLNKSGFKFRDSTKNEMVSFVHGNQFPMILSGLPQKSNDPKVLSMLCDSTQPHIRIDAAMNPDTPSKAVAKVTSKLFNSKENRELRREIIDKHYKDRYEIWGLEK
ncbi:MAG: hypothetical protein NT030_04390 [Candidatus Saganbacteria bacterium]|nr:hypothetical protein [Candidatus Saganbacteria bacterium]